MIADDIKQIDEGTFSQIGFSLVQPATVNISVSVNGGPSVDVYVVDEQGLNAWNAAIQNGRLGQFSYFPQLSMASLASPIRAPQN